MNTVILLKLTLQRYPPRSLPFEHCFTFQDTSLDDLMCVPCVLPGDVLTHLELLGNCFDDQVVVNIANIPGVTRLPLESFFVWM